MCRDLPQGIKFKSAEFWRQNLIHASKYAPRSAVFPAVV